MLLLITPIVFSAGAVFYQVRGARRALVAAIKTTATPTDVQQIVATYGSVENYAVLMHPYSSPIRNYFRFLSAIDNPFSCTAIAAGEFIFIWPPLTFATLMLYRSILQQAKIRKLHVLRVVIYSAAPIAFIGPLLTLIWLINDTGYPFSSMRLACCPRRRSRSTDC